MGLCMAEMQAGQAKLVVQLASFSVAGLVDSSPSWGRSQVTPMGLLSAAPSCPLQGLTLALGNREWRRPS